MARGGMVCEKAVVVCEVQIFAHLSHTRRRRYPRKLLIFLTRP